MTRSKKRQPVVDVREILNRPITVKEDGKLKQMELYEAQVTQCVAKALQGDSRACSKFIAWCLAEGVIAPPEPYDNHEYFVRVPKGWDMNEFVEKYEREGPPPWAGDHDGLTDEERERRKTAAKLRRRGRA